MGYISFVLIFNTQSISHQLAYRDVLMSSSSSSSSSSTPPEKSDVFLSFRGEDTRNGFTSHLYEALRQKGIDTFIDNALIRGDEISPSLSTAIEQSRISVIIFSRDYASSRWCLEELVKIMECKNRYGQIVIPVFYDVDPSNVRRQRGSFGDAFAEHEQRFEEQRLIRWRAALTEAANLSGWNSSVIRPESLLVMAIVKDIFKKLNYMSSDDTEHLVGVDSSIRLIEELLLNNGSVDVCSLGIWGIGGIGKTTIARVVFNKLSVLFEGSYFAQNVREESEKKGGLSSLQEKLISTILRDPDLNIRAFTKNRLGHMKLLIVFDDLTHLSQIEYLIGGLDCLGIGSRVIITTRDKHVLDSCIVDKIYEVKGLFHDESLKLFSWYAFGKNHPKVDYMELSHKVVVYAKDVPLALKILGSFLYGRSKKDWVSKLKKLEKTPDMDIQKVLEISYDELDDDDKNIFLEIACFFKGEDKDLVKQFLDARGFSTEIGITVLLDKSLISISNNMIEMHDLIQAMGREIVKRESSNDPGKRSRLWYHEDIYQVLRNNMGTESIEGISLDMSQIRDLHLNPYTFTKMPKLKYLKFYNSQNEKSSKVHIPQGLESTFTELRYLHWHAYPLKSLPSEFDPENLFVLDMPYSNLEQLWNGNQCFDRLRIINLSHSNLTKIPDISGSPYLESLILAGCTNLIEITPSIQFLNKLIILNLRDCKSLKCLPDCINLKSLRILVLSGSLNFNRFPQISCNIEELFLGETAVEELPSSVQYLSNLVILDLVNCTRLNSLPSSICKLKRLEYLNISGCSKLNSLPDGLKSLRPLKKLKAARTGIREVPSSISCLNNLDTFSLEGCKGLEAMGLVLPCPLLGLSNLTNLVLSECNITELPYSLGWLSSLKRLFLRGNNFESIPTSIIHLLKLILLDISCCERIQSLPTLPRDLKLEAHGCTSLEEVISIPFASNASQTLAVNFINCLQLEQNALTNLVEYALQKIQLMPTAFCTEFDEDCDEMPRVFICYPSSEIPEWFTFQNMGSSVIVMQLPQGWFSDNLAGFALCAVVAFQDHHDDGRGLVLVCEGKFRSQEGYCHVAKSNLIDWGDNYPGILYVGSDHVFLGCDFVMYPENLGEEYYSNEVSMQFYLEDCHSKRMECCEVKRCGVRLIYSQDESKERTNRWFGADMEEEEEDPFSPDPKRRKLFASFEDGSLMEGEQMQRSETELPETVRGRDIRFQALRTSDQHSGRVGSSEEQRLAVLEATVQALAAQLNNTMIREYDVSRSNLPPEDQDRSCQSAVGSNEHVLATRTILEYTTSDVIEINELEFDQVSLLSLENDDELLININNTVDHHHLPGQENLVVHTSQKVASFHCVEKERKLIPTIEVFLKLVEKSARVDINTSIEVSHEEDTFGNRCLTIITLEDCHIIISMTELTVSCINVYIRILYDKLKDDGMLGQFGFINPASVSVVGGVLDNAIRRDERAHAIASGLQRATQAQLIFMPYNLGFHWILVVIDMLSMTIYYLDSLRGILRNDLKNIVQNGLRIYHSQNSNCSGGQVNMPWKTVQVPRQPGSVECGYYVLRFMKDIIADPSLLVRNFHGKNRYSKKEIDEVRCEWTAFVSRLM